MSYNPESCFQLTADVKLNFWLAYQKCASTFTRKSDLDIHIEEHKNSEVQLKCIICEIQFDKEKDLCDHNNNEHAHYCDFCQKTFKRVSELKDHHKNSHTLQCDICRTKVTGQDQLKLHIDTFITQWHYPTPGDWVEQVRTDMNDFNLQCDFTVLASKSKIASKCSRTEAGISLRLLLWSPQVCIESRCLQYLKIPDLHWSSSLEESCFLLCLIQLRRIHIPKKC